MTTDIIIMITMIMTMGPHGIEDGNLLEVDQITLKGIVIHNAMTMTREKMNI
jgi:hypothetical protein